MAKGQGISINVIIIAAIALLVLVVLSVIFLGRIGLFGTKSLACIDQGGSCVLVSDLVAGQCPAGQVLYTAWTCPQSGGIDQKCCILPKA
jgi:hypothetical protein